MSVCIDCGRRGAFLRCDPCRRAFDHFEAAPALGSGHLPAREPEPRSAPFCACGALGKLIRAGDGSWLCAECAR